MFQVIIFFFAMYFVLSMRVSQIGSALWASRGVLGCCLGEIPLHHRVSAHYRRTLQHHPQRFKDGQIMNRLQIEKPNAN